MRESATKKWVYLGLWTAALGICCFAGSMAARAAPPICLQACNCKEVLAYQFKDPVNGDGTPTVWLKDNGDGTYSAQTNAMAGINVLTGCVAGNVGVTIDPIYNLGPYGDLVCDLGPFSGLVEATYDPKIVIRVTAPLTPGNRARCVTSP